MTKMINAKVVKAGYYFIGHFNAGGLRLLFNSFRVDVPFNRVGEVLDVFEIECEDGVFFEELEGKLCQVQFDNSKVIAISNILNSEKVYLIEDKKK